MQKPNVFIKARFDDSIKSNDPLDKKKYKRRLSSWTKDYKWYKYVTRDDACLKSDVDYQTIEYLIILKQKAISLLKEKYEKNDMQELIGTVAFEKDLIESKAYKLFLEAITTINKDTKFTGLWDENGAVLIEDENKKLKQFSKIKDEQLVFEQVFSLSKEFMVKNKIVTPKQFYETIKNQMPTIIKNYGFYDPTNINWNVAFHVNTENLHAHISFWEKKPKFIEISKDGKRRMVFKRKGNIEHRKFLDTSYNLEKEFIEDNFVRNEIYRLRNDLLDPFNNLTRTNLDHKEWEASQEIYHSIQKAIGNNQSDLLKIANELSKNKLWYNSKNMSYSLRNRINKLSYDLIKKDSKMNKNFELFQINLKMKQQELINLSRPYFQNIYPNLYKSQNVTKADLTKAGIKEGDKLYNIFSLYEEQMFGADGFFSRIGNQFIKELKRFDFVTVEKPLPTNSQVVQQKKAKTSATKKNLSFCIKNVLAKAENEAMRKYRKLQRDINESINKVQQKEKWVEQ